MFTGIVETTAKINYLNLPLLRIERPASFDDIEPGSSIAVNGCCLTVEMLSDTEMEFTLTNETIKLTTFVSKKTGDLVNLERAMPAGGRLDGHIVQGHVEGTGEVVEALSGKLSVRIQKEFKDFVLMKGSIAIDGVSLTIASIEGDVLSFAIIPFTWEHTIMNAYKEGDTVNIETDVMAKYGKK